MAYHYQADEHAGNRSLDYYSRRYTQVGGYKDDIDKGNLINEPLERVARYNGTDAAIVPGIIESMKIELEGWERDLGTLEPDESGPVPAPA